MLQIFALIAAGVLLFSCQKEKLPVPEVVKVVPPSTAVARLAELKPEAQVKGKTLDWQEARVEHQFENQDQLRTDDGASARIVFLSGKASLSVAANSLVVIWDRDEEKIKNHVVAIPKGEVTGSLDSDQNETLEIRTPAGWVKTDKKSRIKVSSKGIQNGFKVSVIDGQAEIVTSSGKASIKQGKSIKLISRSQDLSLIDYISSIPLESALEKEKVFRITLPVKKEFRTKDSKIDFQGIWEGGFSVWANGKALEAKSGRLAHTFELVPGLNVINFQVSDTDKKNVEYHIYKIVREDSP